MSDAGGMAFGLFFFSNDGSVGGKDKYRLLLECARFADRHGLAAVWTPERHFQAFGGLYPNPALLAAALAMETERVQIRAGSLVLPLHHPIRVAEDWAVVDNLSGGRVGISFGSGWHPQDFVLAPESYALRKEYMFRHIQTIQALWEGRKVRFVDRDGHEHELGILPRPIQPTLPLWISIAGNVRTWIQAGQIGANVLTGLSHEPPEGLSGKIRVYREALLANGYVPEQKTITVMLHTFLGDDAEEARARARDPIKRYLEGFLRQRASAPPPGGDGGIPEVGSADREALLEHAARRYCEGSALVGSPAECLGLVRRLAGLGVNEVACLVDFGLDVESVLEGLTHLNDLREACAGVAASLTSHGGRPAE